MTHPSEISDGGTRQPAAYKKLPDHLRRPINKRHAVFDSLHVGILWLDHVIVAGFCAILQAFVEGMNAYVGNAHYVKPSVRHDSENFENE